jgi:hypothetical protein
MKLPSGNEVDFVVPVGEKLHLFECQMGRNARSRAARGRGRNDS